MQTKVTAEGIYEMICIRTSQMDALSRDRREGYVERLANLLEEGLPEYSLGMPKQDWVETVTRFVDEALYFNINIESDTGNYVQMRIECEEKFDEALCNDAGFRRILEDRKRPGSEKLAIIGQKFFAL